MKVEKYSGFEFWAEDSQGRRIPEQEDCYVKGAQRHVLIVPVNQDLIFCIKKGKVGARGSADRQHKQDFAAYLMIDGRELGAVYIKRGNSKVIKMRRVYEEIDGELNCTSLRLNPLPETPDAMAPQLPHLLGRISLQVYKVFLKNRGSKKIPLTPFREIHRVVIGPQDGVAITGDTVGARQRLVHGIVRGESDLCEMEETRQRYIIDESAGQVDRKDDPWLSMEFDYKPDFSVSDPLQAPLAQVAILQQKVHALEGVVGDLQRKAGGAPTTPASGSSTFPTGQARHSVTRPGSSTSAAPQTATSTLIKRTRSTYKRECDSPPLSELDDHFDPFLHHQVNRPRFY